MTDANISLVVITSLLLLSVGAVTVVAVSRRVRDAGDWLVAGRSLPLYVIVFTQFATAVGGGVLVAHVGLAYASGWAYFFYPAFIFVGMMLLTSIARWMREQEFSTVPGILRRLYNEHPAITTLAALACIVVPFGWLATQFVAFASLFAGITGLSTTWLTVIMGAITLVFVLPGGLRSVAWSDFLFGVVMVIMSVTVAGYVLNLAGGWSGITSAVPNNLTALPEGLGAAGTSTVVLWLFSIIPGTLTNQMYYQRIFSIRDIGQARKSLVISGVLVLVSGAYAFIIGMSARAMNPGLADSEMAAGWILTQLPPLLLALYAAFLMATIVSTTGSALQSVVTNAVQDIYVHLFGHREGVGLVHLSRLLSVAVVVLAALLAILFPTALTWLVATYAYSASVLAAPIFIGYFLHKRGGLLRSGTALAGIVGGLIGCAAAHTLDTTIPYAIYGIVSSVVFLLVAHAVFDRRGPTGSAPTQPRAPELDAHSES
ncbi:MULTISPECIES: sodium:solute symporter family protein [Actinopolyspora]|uniref:sodium:solute symporter family protein n=1 Tax=Actinopolyspora TaxID=1849 RepID=UPI00037AA376|nr:MULTISPECIES: sodium:solute symporter family protein [Actinopolyspora]NHD17764.1 sodium:solute symporter family protein [Actinopolyspora sp. BKK2]NHE76503.1 sodium:solute symporter family protein [Actinopolyspora sp. BKK1]